jgi:hypothetical protein
LVNGLEELGSSLTVGQNLVLACPELNLKSVHCRVEGDLLAMGCRTHLATSPELEVQGSAVFDECPGLRGLRGWVGKNLTIRNGCGLENIGADFECGGDMTLVDCKSLKNINCRVGGDAYIHASTLEKTGPAFSCQGSLTLESVEGVKMLAGTVEGECRFSSQEMVEAGIVMKISKKSTRSPTPSENVPNFAKLVRAASEISSGSNKSPSLTREI